MINKKEKILKNYLNNETFKENLMKQQNKLLKLYNKENNNNLEDFSYIKPSTFYYNNKSLNLSEGNFNRIKPKKMAKYNYMQKYIRHKRKRKNNY